MNDVPPPESEQGMRPDLRPAAGPPSADDTNVTDQTWPMVPPPLSAAPPPSFPVRNAPPAAPAARAAPRTAAGRSGSARRGAVPPPIPPATPYAYTMPERAARPRRRQPVAPQDSGLYLPWWSLVIMVGTVGVLAFALVFVFTELSGPALPGDQAPRIVEITAMPTLGQEFTAGGQAAAPAGGAWPTAIPQALPTPTVPLPTPIPTQTLPPGEFVIGARVQVVGVGATRLNVRAAPGLSGEIVFLAEEGDVFAIVGGPQSADGFEWWKVQRLDDATRVGWAARNFLMAATQ